MRKCDLIQKAFADEEGNPAHFYVVVGNTLRSVSSGGGVAVCGIALPTHLSSAGLKPGLQSWHRKEPAVLTHPPLGQDLESLHSSTSARVEWCKGRVIICMQTYSPEADAALLLGSAAGKYRCFAIVLPLLIMEANKQVWIVPLCNLIVCAQKLVHACHLRTGLSRTWQIRYCIHRCKIPPCWGICHSGTCWACCIH